MKSGLDDKKIAFILPGYSRRPVGGFKVVYEYAEVLAANGCDVTIYFWCDAALRRYGFPEPARRAICRALVAYFPRWYRLDPRVHKGCVFTIDDASIAPATDVVATSVLTAGPVARLASKCGRKHYLIQGYETWALPEREVCDTYRLGMSNIVVSRWLAEIVSRESGARPRVIKNPINQEVFYPDARVERHPHEVACLYHEAEYKGFEDLYRALEIVKGEIPDLKVNIFGGPTRPSWMPGWFRYTRDADESQLREIYSRSAVFACAAVNEGFGLTPAESMFCGCALASTSFRGVWEYADEECALLSPIHDVERLASNIARLLKSPGEASALADRGRHHAMAQCSLRSAAVEVLDEFGVVKSHERAEESRTSFRRCHEHRSI